MSRASVILAASVTLAAASGSTLFVHPVSAGEAFASTGESGAVQRGYSLYRQICAKCHGPNMVNPGTASFDLRKFPEDDPNRFFTSVTQGKGNMPAHGDILQAGEIEALWSYVKTKGKI